MPVEVQGGGGSGGPAGADIGCRVIMTADQLISHGTHTPVNFDAEDYDTDSMHDNAVNNTRVTFNTAGKYLIIVTALWQSSNTGFRILRVRLNGANGIMANYVNAIATSARTISALFEFAITDYIEITVYQNSGGNLNLDGGARGFYGTTSMMAQKIDTGG